MSLLEEVYPDAECSLDADEPWKLLFSAILAAQCTDARVNVVVVELYRAFPTLSDIAAAPVAELERLVYSTGFYSVKARNIKACAQILITQYGGGLPDTMDGLLALPGVGRKIANLILGDVFGQPAIVADTHCIRLANRFGLCETTDPLKVERALLPLIPPERSNGFCHRCVDHGRAVCTARGPRCGECGLAGVCAKAGVKQA